jgi:hypothetical protein
VNGLLLAVALLFRGSLLLWKGTGSNRGFHRPGLHDVVFRVGDSYLCHPGNAKFRGWIESTFEDYDSASKDRKVAITWMLVDEVLKTGRFLVWDKHWWVVLWDREKMRTKVMSRFHPFDVFALDTQPIRRRYA